MPGKTPYLVEPNFGWMKRMLLFGAGKSATSLIRYLIDTASTRDWQIVVADNNLALAQSKIGDASHARVVSIDVASEQEREALVKEADIVISLLPPTLHHLVAGSCLKYSRHLLTASYLDPAIRSLEKGIREKGLLFLCEMGLDPGIDHMSAMELVGQVQKEGGTIVAFRSHTGGLVAPESDDNPWHYKISWNPRNVVRAGSAGASYKENNRLINRNYIDLFANTQTIRVKGIGDLAWYANRDSLSYMPLYGLEETETFLRTTLRYPAFCSGWKEIVKAGLTDDETPVKSGLSFVDWSVPLLPYVDDINKEQLEFLGLFDNMPVPAGANTSADILQYLLETRLAMREKDKDMIVMQHEIEYTLPTPDALPGKLQRSRQEVISTLIVKGEDYLKTAMSKTVGLPLGIAARLILEGKIPLTGLHIPIVPEIYVPVLEELATQGICFEKSFNSPRSSANSGSGNLYP
jgi:saccharopine dehydrogenase-like NADP-dependent oxidoreductase